MAILIAVDHWRSYLQLAEFLMITDKKSLIHLTDQRLHTYWQQKVFSKLIDLQYKIVYRKGTDNRVADALSRHPAPPMSLMAISTSTPIWLAKVQEGYGQDPKAQQMIAALAVDPQSVPNFTLSDGILKFKRRIWIGDNTTLQQQVLAALHSSAIGGHSGFLVTYRKLKQVFAWKGMKSGTKLFVQSCTVCQQAKPSTARYPGLLAPLPIPDGAWQVISLDFTEGLPRSGQANCI
jgi:hypothetical protein